ncbi:MAG: hypothetical protein ACRC8S_22720, partial [Fimbriiglobus sp.]
VYAFKSMFSFHLTMAPSYGETNGLDDISIGYHPGYGLFGVGYSEWVLPTHRHAASRSCETAEVGEIIDREVMRLLLSRFGSLTK